MRRSTARWRRNPGGGAATPERLIPNMLAFWDPARGVTLSGPDVLTVADQAAGGVADTLSSISGQRPTFVANDGGFPAFAFSGTLQRFEAADSTDLSPTTALSISAWVKRDVAGTEQSIVAKWTTPTFPWLLHFDSSNNMVWEDSAGANVGYYVFGAGLTWKHIVVTYDGSLSGNANRLKMWENGVQKTLAGFAGTIPATLLDDAQPIGVGGQPSAGLATINGRMGVVALVGRAITQAEINILYNYQGR